MVTAVTARVWKGIDWRLRRFSWNAYSKSTCRLAVLHRRSLTRTAFIGITGSAGKTTAKDLVARILEHHGSRGHKGPGTLNGPYDVACQVLRTRRSHAYCVTEIAITKEAGIELPLALFRPTIGVVTNIGGDHLSAYGSLDGIAAEKSKLIRSLPADGIAILNADDPRVLAMRSQFPGRTITYGTSDGAGLQGLDIEASWPDRLSFTARWNGQSARVQTQLCGAHWVPVVLAALATGVAMGVPLGVAAEAVAQVEPFEARMSPVELDDGVTFIRDDWKAPLWTIAPTFDFMRRARAARKIIVLGTISDYPGDSARRYVQVAEQALRVADSVIVVGPWASSSLRAKRSANDNLWAFGTLREAASHLGAYLMPGDLVLLKGSTRADHLERLILARRNSVHCWRSGCGRMYYCGGCDLLHVHSNPHETAQITTDATVNQPGPAVEASSPARETETVVIGLGNPEEHRAGTRHNVGFEAVDMLARRIGKDWVPKGGLAMVCEGNAGGSVVCLVKPLAPMNDVGPVVLQVAKAMNFDARQCILVHDDLDLPVGVVRARSRGGDGGHRGVRSILQAFQDDRFRRVKIGIGKPAAGQAVLDYVLQKFPTAEVAVIDAATRAAADRVIELVRQDAATRASSTYEMPG